MCHANMLTRRHAEILQSGHSVALQAAGRAPEQVCWFLLICRICTQMWAHDMCYADVLPRWYARVAY